MFNLIRKDILLQKESFKFIIIFVVIFSLIMNDLASSSRYLMYILLATNTFVVTSFSYDNQYRADVVLNSLPLKRVDIVLSKYISVVVYVILSLIGIGGVCSLFIFFKLPVNMEYIHFKMIIDIFSISFLIFSVGLPIIFKFGYRKGKIIFNIALFSSMYALIDTYNIINKTLIESYSYMAFAVATAAFILSFIISNKVYENKDLV